MEKKGFRMGRQLVLSIKSPSGKARLQYVIKYLFPILCKFKYKFTLKGCAELEKKVKKKLGEIWEKWETGWGG